MANVKIKYVCQKEMVLDVDPEKDNIEKLILNKLNKPNQTLFWWIIQDKAGKVQSTKSYVGFNELIQSFGGR